jgi:hypothetical protein
MKGDLMDITPEWQALIDEAQTETHETIGGQSYPRRPYGCEVANPRAQCRDCAVEIEQLHVVGCCVELCPACGGQALSCSCHEASESPVQ